MVEAIACQLRRVDLNANRWQRSAAGCNLTHALDLRQLLFDDCGSLVVKLVWSVLIGGESDDDDGRIRGIDFAICRISRQVGRQIGPRSIDGCLNVSSSSIDVAAQVELDR